jgi:hypothetical protein
MSCQLNVFENSESQPLRKEPQALDLASAFAVINQGGEEAISDRALFEKWNFDSSIALSGAISCMLFVIANRSSSPFHR